MQNSNLPNSYIHAKWRNTTPVDTKANRIGIGFDIVDNGNIIRLALDLNNAKHLKETLEAYLLSHYESIPNETSPSDLESDKLESDKLEALKKFMQTPEAKSKIYSLFCSASN